MKHLIRLTDWDGNDVKEVFRMADALREGARCKPLEGETVVLFFPETAAKGRDVICTDSLSADRLPDFAGYQITAAFMRRSGCQLLNPCPPFYRGEEVSAEVIDGKDYFVGYDFKSSLLEIQQAVLLHCMGRSL